ncbi:MAG: CDP-alcohol phosphatidyltransferase family protein, partial [Actinobacteria bacterium]|nr:CDP-alcohol phosphatidyltransferase family protein [Actinomycetota bacterium]
MQENFNVPNLLSFLRLIGVPYFFWLITAQNNFGLAIVVLFVSGFTDWLDGYAARKLNQQTRLGELMDPLVDRLYVVAAILALVITNELPLVFLILFFARDVFMLVLVWLLKQKGYSGFPVHFIGKAATMNLLWAFPLVLLGTYPSIVGVIAHNVAFAFLIWGLALYWYGAALYAKQYRNLEMGGGAVEQ